MYDYLIIGGGIIGMSVAMQLKQKYPDKRIIVLEKEDSLAYHQTGHNSGVIHSGLYYKPGSLKAKLATAGCRKTVEFCQTHEVPHDVCGKVVVALNDDELPALNTLYERGKANGLTIKKIDGDELQTIEPHVQGVAALHIPATGIVDYKALTEKFAEIFLQAGGEIHINTEVNKIEKSADAIIVNALKKEYQTQFMINCSGLQSDRVAKMAGVFPNSKVVPFKGEYYELNEDKKYLVNNLIYPVPNPDFPFLGVHFTRMMDGSIEVGPNAVLSFKREGYSKFAFGIKDTWDTLSFEGFWHLARKYYREGFAEFKRSFNKAAFLAQVQQYIPEIERDDLHPVTPGIRAQALRKNGELVDDFEFIQTKRCLHVCNAPSPAATASLLIGEEVISRLA